MKLRGDTTGDSLWLLLDTMFSAFGAIILIAILLALISSDVRISTEGKRAQGITVEMLDRRIAQAESDLKAAKSYSEVLAAKLTNSNLSARADLLNAGSQLRSEDERLAGAITNLNGEKSEYEKNIIQAPVEVLNDLTKQLGEANRQKTEEQNTLAAGRQNVQRLGTRLIDLEGKVTSERERRTAKLRLPKERTTSQTAVSIIVKYDRVYPLYDFSTGRLVKNETTIDWRSAGGDSEEATPIRTAGLKLREDRRSIGILLDHIERIDSYVACYVYPDSFETFNQLKALIVQSNLDYGWQPVPEKKILIFSTDGTSPPPL